MLRTAGPALLVLLAAVCFGTTGAAQALGAPDVDSISLGAARIVVGGALLALVALPGVLSADARRASRLVRRLRAGAAGAAGAAGSAGADRAALPSIVLVLIGAVGVAAYQPTFFTGTRENGAAVGAIVALGSAPVLTGVLEWVVTRRRPSARWFVATAIAALGVAVLSGVLGLGALLGDAGGAGAEARPITPLGLVGSLGAGASYAVYAVSSKQLLARGWSGPATMGAQFGGAALIMLPVLLSTDASWLATPAGSVTALWLAVVTVAIAYTLFARGLRSLPAASVATITLAEPATATLLGVFVLREVLTADAIAGVLLLVVAVVVLTVTVRGRREPVPDPGAASTASVP